jgi:cytochrome c-type biogenesis protein CcmH/NrfF
MVTKLRRFVAALAVAGALLVAPGVRAEQGAVAPPPAAAADDPYALELYNGLMSPYCPGRTLMDCPSGQAAELRDWIATQEQAGRPREAVEQELYEKYGDVILQAPRAEGFGLVAYVLPIVAFVLGGFIVWAFLRRQAARAAPPAPRPRISLDPEIERRIDEELRA